MLLSLAFGFLLVNEIELTANDEQSYSSIILGVCHFTPLVSTSLSTNAPAWAALVKYGQ